MADDGGDNLEIRTMKDDLVSAGGKPVPSVAPEPKPVAPAPRSPQGGVGLPLSPKTAVAVPKVPAGFAPSPNLTRRHRRRAMVWLGGIVGIGAIIAGGIWAFVTFFSAPTAVPQDVSLPGGGGVQAGVPIPATALVAIHYGSLTPEVRGQLIAAWQKSSKTLLQGNPTLLLRSPTVNQFMYVALSGDSRPYLIIPKVEMDQQELASFSQSQVAEYGGLYILHALTAQPYLEALRQTQAVNLLTEQLDDTDDPRSLRIYLSQAAMHQLQTGMMGQSWAAVGPLPQELLLAAGPTAKESGWVFETLGGGFEIGGSPIEAGLMPRLPADTRFVRLGGDLSSDVKVWEQVFDKSVLEKSAVAALISQMTTPYAYYQRLGLDGVPDIGLVAGLPAQITPPLVLGDSALEEAVKAATPLIASGASSSNLAFGDGVYQNVPLRFLNLAGAAQALDYTIQANHLTFASSKEGMFALLDAKEDDSVWSHVAAAWGGIPTAPEVLFGYLSYLPLTDLLPVANAPTAFGTARQPGATGSHISGVILFGM